MLRAIQEIKPRFVIAENVFGITNIDGGLVFQQVCLDLENEGYEVQPFIIPACAKNAPHRRDRCWFVAFNAKSKRNTQVGKICKGQNNESIGICVDNENATNSISNGGQEYSGSVGCEIREKESRRHQFANGLVYNGKKSNATNPNGNGFNERNCNDEINPSEGGEYALRDINKSNCNGDDTDTNGWQREQSAFNSGMGRIRQSNEEDSWSVFPTQPPVCGGDDGLPTELDGITFSKWRAESIKGYGNAIVPQIALQLFQILESL